MKFLRPFLKLVYLVILCGLVLPDSSSLLLIRAQSAAPQSPSLNHEEWEKVAGGKRQFDIASVKENNSGQGVREYCNVPLGPGHDYVDNGGLFSCTNLLLVAYMTFAYKITYSERQAFVAQLPKWVLTDRYDIQARSEGRPTKDQMRLMMQSLLADRFKLAVHFETRQIPVLALEMIKAGSMGPMIHPHPANVLCNAQPAPATGPGVPMQLPEDGFPYCGGVGGMNPTVPGRFRMGGRDVTTLLIATQMTGAVDRPVLDRTGLTGTFDFTLEWMPDLDGPSDGSAFQPDATGPTFLEALKDQLGLKLVPQTGPVDVLVIDHVEEPTPN